MTLTSLVGETSAVAQESKDPKPSASPSTIAFPKRRLAEYDPIWVGEKQELTVSFLGFNGLHFEIEVLPFETVNKRKTYHARASVRLASLLDLVYSLNDTVETWIDYEGMFSHKFHLVQKETKITREAWEEHDHIKGETNYRNLSKKKDENLETSNLISAIPRFGQDTFSSYYFLRSRPLEVGETYRVPVVSEGNTMEVLAQVQGVDLVKAHGEDIQAVQVKLEKLDSKGTPISGQNNLVWLSNDERRILVRVDVKTRFGHVIGELTKYSPGTK